MHARIATTALSPSLSQPIQLLICREYFAVDAISHYYVGNASNHLVNETDDYSHGLLSSRRLPIAKFQFRNREKHTRRMCDCDCARTQSRAAVDTKRQAHDKLLYCFARQAIDAFDALVYSVR